MTELLNIQSQLESISEDARSAAWMRLYLSNSDDLQMELIQILTSENDVRKIQFARFLGKVPEHKAILYLIQILFEDNNNVIQQAIRSFNQNTYSDKYRDLLPLLEAKNHNALEFAIEQLSEKKILDAVDPLISLLQNKPNNIKLAVLSGFRFLGDKRTLPHIIEYCNHSNTNIQFHAILAIGSLYQKAPRPCRKILIKALTDSSARIRQTAVWTLHQHSLFGLQSIFRKLSSEDKDPNVRQECLVALTKKPTKKNVKHIIQQLADEKSQSVILKAEAALLTVPEKQLTKGLKSVLKDKSQKGYSHALTLYAEFHRKDEQYLKYLIKKLKQTQSTKDRLPIIESMGYLENEKALPILNELLNVQGLEQYTAITAITKIWNKSKPFPILNYMNHEKLSEISKQIALKYFMKQAQEGNYTADVVHNLIKFLKSKNINIRYLSAQSLVKCKQISVIEPFFKSFLKETDPASKEFFKQSLIQFINSKPKSIVSVFKNHHNEANSHETLLSLMKEIFIEKSIYNSILVDLLSPPIRILKSSFQSYFIELIYEKISSEDIDLEKLCESLADKTISIKLLTHLSDYHQKQSQSPQTHIPSRIYDSLLQLQEFETLAKILPLLNMDPRDWTLKYLIQLSLLQDPHLYNRSKTILREVIYD